jgi:hypothetical protein
MADTFTLADYLRGGTPATDDRAMWWATPPPQPTMHGKGSVQQIAPPQVGQHTIGHEWVPAAMGPQKGAALWRAARTLIGWAGRIGGLEGVAAWRGEDSPSSAALQWWREQQALHPRRFALYRDLNRMGADRATVRRLVWGDPNNPAYEEFPVIEGPDGSRY